jgi:hypothetical protein
VLISVTKKVAGKIQAGFNVAVDAYASPTTDCDMFRVMVQ